jgi:hypothetical protein
MLRHSKSQFKRRVFARGMTSRVDELESKVSRHLERMGFRA